MATNQTEGSRLEQKSVIKFWLAEKNKLCEFTKCVMFTERNILVK